MNMEEQVQAAIAAELARQAADSRGELKVTVVEDDTVRLEGPVDLAAIAMAVVGAVAGGP